LKSNLIVYGVKEAFRTAVAAALADRLDLLLCDTDLLIEYTADMSAADYIVVNEFEAFKRLETKIICQACEYRDVVLSVNGNSFDEPVNAEMLYESGVMIWLKSETLEDDGPRPGTGMLPRLQEFLRSRSPAFAAFAELIIDVDGLMPEEVVGIIVDGLKNYTERCLVSSG